MKKVFKEYCNYRCPAPTGSGYNILTVISRTEESVVYICIEHPELGAQKGEILLVNEPLSEGFNVIPAYKTEAIIPWTDENGSQCYCYATDYSEEEYEAEINRYLTDWKECGIVDKEGDMKKLVNILQAHGETMDSLKEFIASKEEVFCGFVWIDLPETEREVAELLFDHNLFYSTREELFKACCKDKQDTDMSLKEFLDGEDIRKTAPGYVRVLHY